MNSIHKEKKMSGQFVVPGERLAVIEEFMSGCGTYIAQNVIYSKIVGRVLLDVLNKEAVVHPLTQRVCVPQTGSVVTGQVSSVQSQRAALRIAKIGKRELTGFFSGLLHISSVSPRYIETMFEVCRRGDIMRAKVVSNLNRTYHLSTSEKNLGVIYALCSRCGYPLTLKNRGLGCLECGKNERRKVALNYGSEAIKED